MKKTLLLATLAGSLCATAPAFASPECTKEPKDKWLSEEAMKAKATELGYKADVFKVEGNCYEIYGYNKDGKEVESTSTPSPAKWSRKKSKKKSKRLSASRTLSSGPVVGPRIFLRVLSAVCRCSCRRNHRSPSVRRNRQSVFIPKAGNVRLTHPGQISFTFTSSGPAPLRQERSIVSRV